MVSINLKYMNNKSRKGLYYYIKEKGHRGQYYKADSKNIIQAEEIADYYNKKYVQKKEVKYHKTFEAHKKTPKKTKDKIKEAMKHKKIDGQIKKGRSEATIKNVETASKKRISNATEKLLRKSITTPEIRKKLAKYEQQKKYKQYITHYIEFYDKENNKLISGKVFNKTTHKLINDLQKKSVKGDQFTQDDNYNSLVLDKLKYSNLKAIQQHKSGRIHHYNLRIILRK